MSGIEHAPGQGDLPPEHEHLDGARRPLSPAPAADSDEAGQGGAAGGDGSRGVAAGATAGHDVSDDERSRTTVIHEPAKILRIGEMIKRLLDEVRSAPLDEAARARLAEVHERSLAELEDGLSPELVAELHRITLPFTDDAVPSEAELRIAQAQLVGWLEGLFHGLQTAMVAQQMAAQAQLQQVQGGHRALPAGLTGDAPGAARSPGPDSRPTPGQYL